MRVCILPDAESIMRDDTYPVLLTERLVLRGFTLNDAPVVCRLAGDYEVSRRCLNIPYPYPEEVAVNWITNHLEWYKSMNQVIFAVCRDDLVIGACGLALEMEHFRGELGYWIGTEFQGMGYATEAAKAVVEYGFSDLCLNRITGSCITWNKQSYRVFEKIGFKREGLLRRHVKKDDCFEDIILCGLLKDDFVIGSR